MMEVYEDERLLDALSLSERTGLRVLVVRGMAVAMTFAGSVLIARSLGPSGRGLYALPVAQLAIVVALSHLGLEHANVYLAARHISLPRLWSMSAIAALLLSAISGLVLLVIYAASGGSAFGGVSGWWLVVVMGQLPLLLGSLFWAGLLQVSGHLRDATIRAAVGAGAQLLVVVVLFAGGLVTPFRALAILWVSTIVTTTLLLVRGRQLRLTGEWRLEISLMRRALAFGVRAYVGLVFVFLLLRLDQLIVEAQLGFRALGLYSIAVLAAESIWLITDPFAAAILPHQLSATETDHRRLGHATARLNVLVGVTAAVGAWFVAPFIIPILFGDRYAPAVWPFRLLLPGVVVFVVQRPLAQILLKEGRLTFVIVFTFLALIFNVGGNILVLPHVGLIGASLVSTLTYVIATGAYVAATRLPGVPVWRSLVPRGRDVGRLLRAFR